MTATVLTTVHSDVAGNERRWAADCPWPDEGHTEVAVVYDWTFFLVPCPHLQSLKGQAVLLLCLSMSLSVPLKTECTSAVL